MTSFRTIYLRCPTCRTILSASVLASSNNFGQRLWSDGWGCARLSSPRSPLRVCTCGALFSPAGTAVTAETAARSLAPTWRTLWGLRGKAGQTELAEAELADFSTILRDIRSGQLSALDAGSQLLARRWLWWGANHAQRGEGRWSKITPPDMTPNEGRENLEALVALLEGQGFGACLELGDAYRQLGRFGEAAAIYQNIEGDLRGQLEQLARNKMVSVVEVNSEFIQ